MGDPIPPWEQPGADRLDRELHRAGFLWSLTQWSLGLGFLSLFCIVPAIAALPLGLIVCVLAQRDLLEMRAGRMDASGAYETRFARNVAALGIVCACAALVLGICLLVREVRGGGMSLGPPRSSSP